MRNKCLLGLGLVFVISLTSMVAFAFSFTGTPADEVDETEMIVRAVVSEEADAMPTMEPITTTGQEQEMVKNEQSKIGSMDWDSDDAYRLVGEEWTGDGIDFCGIEESVFKILELQLNNMIMAMKATMEVLK